MFTYTAFGLIIQSELPLPELQIISGDAAPDLTIQLGSLAPLGAQRSFELHEGEARLFWPECGVYAVRSGSAIIVDPHPAADPSVVRLPILGTALAVALHQRGQFVLHANAVAVNGKTIVIVGDKGRGKSTLTAALCAGGHMLVADDVVAIDPQCPQPYVTPGFAQIKIWPDSAAASLGEVAQLPRLATGYDKLAWRPSAHFAAEPQLLQRIYVLDWGAEPFVRSLPPQAMIAQLITHTYVARFGEAWLWGADRASHLRHTAWVLRHAPLAALERPHSLARLPELVDVIERDLATLAPADEQLVPA